MARPTVAPAGAFALALAVGWIPIHLAERGRMTAPQEI